MPDSIIAGARDRNALETSLDAEQMAVSPNILFSLWQSLADLRLLWPALVHQSGYETPATALQDFAEIGQAREKMLSIKLEQQAGTDSVSGQTTIDPKGYLTGLESQVLKSNAEIG